MRPYDDILKILSEWKSKTLYSYEEKQVFMDSREQSDRILDIYVTNKVTKVTDIESKVVNEKSSVLTIDYTKISSETFDKLNTLLVNFDKKFYANVNKTFEEGDGSFGFTNEGE